MQLMRKAEAAFLNSHIAPGVLADVIKSDIDQHAVLEKIADWIFRCGETACPEDRKPPIRSKGNRKPKHLVRQSRHPGE